MTYKHKQIEYEVKACEPGDPDYELRPLKQNGAPLTDYPPAYIIQGRSAKYGLFPGGTRKPGKPVVFRVYNLREGQNYCATPFGKAGFTIVDGNIKNTHQFRAKPTRKVQIVQMATPRLLPRRWVL